MWSEADPRITQLNHTLPSPSGAFIQTSCFQQIDHTTRVMTLLLRAAFFTAMDRQFATSASPAEVFVNDENRTIFLHMSRGLAIILLTVYVLTFIYMPCVTPICPFPDTYAPELTSITRLAKVTP
jgi:hypothetical protein